MTTTPTKTSHGETSTTGSGLYASSGSAGGAGGSISSDPASSYGSGSSSYGSGSSSYGSGSSSADSTARSTGTTAGSASSQGQGQDTDENENQIRRMVDGSREMAHKLQGTVEERPVAALLGVAGVSFVAGSLLGSRIGQLALAIGIGYMAANVLRNEGGVRNAIDHLNADNALDAHNGRCDLRGLDAAKSGPSGGPVRVLCFASLASFALVRRSHTRRANSRRSALQKRLRTKRNGPGGSYFHPARQSRPRNSRGRRANARHASERRRRARHARAKAPEQARKQPKPEGLGGDGLRRHKPPS